MHHNTTVATVKWQTTCTEIINKILANNSPCTWAGIEPGTSELRTVNAEHLASPSPAACGRTAFIIHNIKLTITCG